jgi:hypothetical protein
MLPPRESNPSDAVLSSEEPLAHNRREGTGMNLLDRVTELEARNLHLQSLVVELLNKNEQLRREVKEKKSAQ